MIKRADSSFYQQYVYRNKIHLRRWAEYFKRKDIYSPSDRETTLGIFYLNEEVDISTK